MIELYPHNKQAYENVLKKFETSNKTCVIHPTGTGKTFISLKWLYDNKDKKCLFLTSSNIIIDQLIEYIEKSNLSLEDFPNLELIPYHSLKDNNKKYDCIVLDEFHRCGAKEWGKEVKHILDKNKNSKILGISATPIRYLDNQRDMSEELFDGNIASKMSLAEAVARKILPVPKYINCIYSFKEEIDKIQKLIDKEKNFEYKKQLQTRLDSAKKQLDGVENLSDIFEKNISNKKGKYVVFCKDKKHLEQMREETQKWFSKVNPNINVYTITSDYEKEMNKYTINRFENVKNDSVDLLFSIEMLNEGLHAKGIDGVIMLRPTYSPIVYFQQLGRALSTNSKQPLIFDIVNNFESFDSIYSFRIELEEVIENLKLEYEKEENFEKIDELEQLLNEFKIINEQQNFSELLQNIHMDATFTWDSWYNLALNYYETHKNLNIPFNFKTLDGINYNEDGFKLGLWIYHQRNLKMDNMLSKDRIEKLEKLQIIWSIRDNLWDTKYELAKKYFNHYGNLNVPVKFKTSNGIDYDENGINLGMWLFSKRSRKDKQPKERQEQLEKIGMVWDVLEDIWNKNYGLAKKYYECYGNLNISYSFKTNNGIDYEENGINLGVWLSNQRLKKEKLTKEKIHLLEEIGIVWDIYEQSWNTYYDLAKKYYEINGDLKAPQDFEMDGKNLGSWISKNRNKKDKLSQEKIRQLEQIGMIWDVRQDSWNINYELAKKYYEYNGDLNIPVKFKTNDGIKYDEKGISLGVWIFHLRQNKDGLSQERLKQLEEIGMIWDVYEENWNKNFELAKKYYEHYGDLRIMKNFKTSNGVEYDENGIKLGIWLTDQRQNKKKGVLQEDKFDKLESIGMIWDMNEELWNINYNLSKIYYEHYGNLKIPQDFKTTNGIDYEKDGIAIGTWVSFQRKLKNNGKLSRDKIAKLETIGMIWNIKENKLLTSEIETQEQITEYLYNKLNSLLENYSNMKFEDKNNIDNLNKEFKDSIYIAKTK